MWMNLWYSRGIESARFTYILSFKLTGPADGLGDILGQGIKGNANVLARKLYLLRWGGKELGGFGVEGGERFRSPALEMIELDPN